MNSKISIVTPSFNQGKYLEETIDSVLSQEYQDLEYIIIDGGSTDESVEIIKKYQKYLKYWVSETDYGQSHAIQKGLEHCTGDIFNWLNSDDLLVKESLNTIAENFKQRDIDILSGNEIHFSGNEEVLKHGTRVHEQMELNLLHAAFYQPSTYWKLDVFRRYSLVTDLHYLMDTFLWVQYLLDRGTYAICKIDEPIAKFRLHEHSKTVSQNDAFEKERWTLRFRLAKDLYGLNEKFLNLEKLLGSTVQLPTLKARIAIDCDRLGIAFLEHLLGALVYQGFSSEARKVAYHTLWKSGKSRFYYHHTLKALLS